MVSFHRVRSGPKRYITLLDSHLRRKKLDALVRTAHKALASDTVIDPKRCEGILLLLLENSRIYDAESLVKADTFHVSARSFLLIMNPLIAGNKYTCLLE